MNEEIKEILNIYLIFEYYKNKNIFDRYKVLIDSGRLVIDNECLDILENPKVMLYLTPFKKYKQLKEENQKLNKIIDELEKFIKEGCDLTCGSGITNEYIYAYENALDKVLELKKEVNSENEI